MNIFQKLLEAKKQLPYLKKDKKGFNYTYVTPSQVFAAVNPILNELGIILVMNVIESKSYPIEISTKNGPKTEWKFDMDFVFDWIDTETAEKLSIPWKASGVNGEDKGLGSALTYAERYFILKQFNIPTDDDDPDAFQNKHMSDDDRAEIARDAKDKRFRDINSHIAKLATCKDVDELKTLKSILPAWVVDTPEFKRAGTIRFAELTKILNNQTKKDAAGINNN